MRLLTGDWHLDDNPRNEYRWKAFEHLREAVAKEDITHVCILGDIVDRKDRHSAYLVNRLIQELRRLAGLAEIIITRGNHDTTLHGPSFWEFLSGAYKGLSYITTPTPRDGALFLPYSPNPREEWKGLKLNEYRALFLHATVSGVSENGVTFTSEGMPPLPRNIKIYSGDIHTPQAVRNVVYVGAPHPVKFGDQYRCRFLLINSDYEIIKELPIKTVRKHVIEISSIDDLASVDVLPGDQAKFRVSLSANNLDEWGKIQAAINGWAGRNKIDVASTEITIPTEPARGDALPEQDPTQILRDFAFEENISDELLEAGIRLLENAK